MLCISNQPSKKDIHSRVNNVGDLDLRLGVISQQTGLDTPFSLYNKYFFSNDIGDVPFNRFDF